VQWVPWHDAAILQDIDTPEDCSAYSRHEPIYDLQIAAVVLAAGRSQRMGQPKMVLPWGDTTVIGQVVRILSAANLGEIVVVTGGSRQEVEEALKESPARIAHNPRFVQDQMTLSLQVGLASLSPGIDAALIALGDQPQIQLEVVQQVLRGYQETRALLVFPSYQMRRGHPWIIARQLWGIIQKAVFAETENPEISSGQSLRDILHAYTDRIHYVEVPNDSILRDLDTPTDYLRERPDGLATPDH
jgi:molybdenum cofactor cytidylyltransferase